MCFCNSPCNRHITPAVSDLYPSGAMAIFWICRADCCTNGRMSSTKLQHIHQVNGQRAHSSPKSWCQDTPTESFHVLPRQKLPIAWTVSPLPFAGLYLDFMCLFPKFCALSPFVLGLLLKFSVWSKGIPTGLATTSTQPSLEAPSIARFTEEASNQKTRFSSRLSSRI